MRRKQYWPSEYGSWAIDEWNAERYIALENSLSQEHSMPFWIRGPPGPELGGPQKWRGIPWNADAQGWIWTRASLRAHLPETVRVAVRQTHEMRFNACPRERLDRRPEEHRLVVGVRDHEQHSSPPIWRITSRTPFSCPCSSPEQPPHADIDDGPDEKQRDDDQP